MFMASPSAGFHSSVSAALFYCPNALHYLYRYDRDVPAAQPCLQPWERHGDEMRQANQPFIYCNLFTCSSKCRLIISVCACRSKEVSPQHCRVVTRTCSLTRNLTSFSLSPPPKHVGQTRTTTSPVVAVSEQASKRVRIMSFLSLSFISPPYVVVYVNDVSARGKP